MAELDYDSILETLHKETVEGIIQYLKVFNYKKIQYYIAEMLDDTTAEVSDINQLAELIAEDGKDLKYLVRTHNLFAEDYGLPLIAADIHQIIKITLK